VAPPRSRRPELARFAAVIFDMDGVLVDGEPLHFAAVNEVLGEEGIAISFADYAPHMGTKYGWEEMIQDLGLSHPKEHYSARFRELMVARYQEHSVALPGAIELVTGLREAGMPIALCSSSIRPWVNACLERIGLARAFDGIVTGDEVAAGKPDPAIYLLAARKLGKAPAECLAIEDAPAGIESAHNAGMTCWAVRTEYTAGLELPNPERELASLTDVNLQDLLGVAA
jgi:HAD superfamily hydrolase (TIGR01509 family)